MDVLVRSGRALIVTAGGTLLAMTAFTAPLSIVPALAADLAASTSATSWILSSMSLGLGVALLTSGAIGDEVGRRKVFIAGAILLGVGSAACGLAPTAMVFIVGRVAEGLGAAALIACGLALISHTFPAGHDRTRAIGIWGACMGAGPAVGPLLGSVLDAVSSWRYAYLVITVLAVALAVTGWSWLTESRSGRDRGVDLPGAALLGIGLGCLLAALTEGRQGWTNTLVLVLLAVALVFLVVFGVHQHRAAKAMLDLSLFRRPALVSATLAAFVAGAGIIALMSFISTVLERGAARSAVASALIVLAWSGTSALIALLARHLPARLSGGTRLSAGLIVLAIGLIPLAVLSPGSSIWQLVAGLVVAGAGTGIVNATLGGEAVASVPPTRAGIGSGINNASRYVGAAVGVTVVSTIALRPGTDVRATLIDGWNLAVLLGIALTLVTAFAVILLQRADHRWLRSQSNPAAQPSCPPGSNRQHGSSSTAPPGPSPGDQPNLATLKQSHATQESD